MSRRDRRTEPGHGPIRLVQWNVSMDEDPHRIIGVLRDIDPDIACLQEVVGVPGDGGLLDLAHASGLTCTHAVAHIVPRRGRPIARGNAILSREAPLSARRVPLRPMTDGVTDDRLQGRILVEARFGTERPLRVASAHLSYVPGFETPEWKAAEFHALDTAIGAADRLVLGADLNAPPCSPGVALLRRRLGDAGPEANVPTWTTKRHADGEFVVDTLSWRLDHVLVGPGIDVVASDVLTTGVSDHLPIVVTLAVGDR